MGVGYDTQPKDAAMFSPHASTLLMIGGIALVSFLLMRGSLGFFIRRRGKDDGPKEIRKLLGERSRDSALADAPPEVLRWQVEMHETARDLKAELDSKLSALQALVLLARQERERLEQAIRHASCPPAGPANSVNQCATAGPASSAGRVPAETVRDTLAAIEDLADPAAMADPTAMARVIGQLPAAKVRG